MTTNPELGRFRQVAGERREEAEHLAIQVERLSEMSRDVERFWRGVEYDIEAGNIVSLGLRVQKEISLVSIMRRRSADITELAERIGSAMRRDAVMLEELAHATTPGAEAVARRFHREFPVAAEEAGLRLDSTSRVPTYTLHDGFIELHTFSSASSEAVIIVRDGEPSERIGLDVREVIRRLKEEENRLFGRPHPEGLVQRLFTAYLAVLREERQEPGAEVSLRKVMNRLGKNTAKTKQFRADEFNVDLARLLSTGDVKAGGYRMQVNQTRNKRQGMLLHGMEQGGYVGFMSFKEDTEENTPA